jgi:hypothetical protein
MAERVTEPVLSLFDIDRFREVTLLADEMEPAASGDSGVLLWGSRKLQSTNPSKQS